MKDLAAQDERSVDDFIASLDEPLAEDCHVLIAMMQRISGHAPRLLNVGTIGFDSYHYAYDSGREGDCHVLGFYPRKGKITIYLMDGTAPHADLLDRLGRATRTRVCVYLKRLSDIELPILEQVLQDSYDSIKSQDGHLHEGGAARPPVG